MYNVWWIVDDFTSLTCDGRVVVSGVSTLAEAERIRNVMIERLNLPVDASGVEEAESLQEVG